MDKNNIKLAIVGSRTFNDYATLLYVTNSIKRDNGYTYTEIVSGGAKGADSLAERYAEQNKIPTKIFRADWNRHGKRAGFIRNVYIIDDCDVCICFWDGSSHGTKHDIELCKEKGKVCWIYNFITQKIYVELNRNDD